MINIEADVITNDGHHVGEVDRVVMDPRSLNVTHIVIRRGLLLTRDIVVPTSAVAQASKKAVYLNIPLGELEKMPDFIEKEFVSPPQAAPIGPYVPTDVLWPTGYAYAPAIIRERRNVPENEVDVTEGTDVFCVDGKIGVVDEVLFDTSTGHLTNFIVRQGTLLTRDVSIPVSWVKCADANKVELNCAKDEIERLARQQKER